MEYIGLTIPYDSGFTHVLFNLAAQGFEYIKIYYSGGGDSGCIDDVYLVHQGSIKIEDDVVSENNDRDYAHPNQELRVIIEEKAYHHVLDGADDWYNNDGGGGTLYISTMDGSYHADHYVNVTDTIDSKLTGQFGDE